MKSTALVALFVTEYKTKNLKADMLLDPFENLYIRLRNADQKRIKNL